jgi:hypothetical protein
MENNQISTHWSVCTNLPICDSFLKSPCAKGGEAPFNPSLQMGDSFLKSPGRKKGGLRPPSTPPTPPYRWGLFPKESWQKEGGASPPFNPSLQMGDSFLKSPGRKKGGFAPLRPTYYRGVRGTEFSLWGTFHLTTFPNDGMEPPLLNGGKG